MLCIWSLIMKKHHTPHSYMHQICPKTQNYRYNSISVKFTNLKSICAYNLETCGLAHVQQCLKNNGLLYINLNMNSLPPETKEVDVAIPLQQTDDVHCESDDSGDEYHHLFILTFLTLVTKRSTAILKYKSQFLAI